MTEGQTKDQKIEQQYDEMVKSQGTKKNQTPEYKVNSTLKTAQNAIAKALATIKADHKLKELVNLSKLEKIDVTKCSNVKKDTETDSTALARAVYNGERIDIIRWQNSQLRKGAPKSSSGKATLYNIASDSCIDAANAIVAAVTKGKKKMGEIVDDAFNSIPRDKHKKIHKDGTPEKVKEKIKLIAGKMSGTLAKNFDKLNPPNKKLVNDKGEYKVVDANTNS